MQLFAPSLAFVDLETTGTRAAADRITEVGIVRVDADAHGGPPRVHEWSSLVDPEVPIPAVIQALTGITDEDVKGQTLMLQIAYKSMLMDVKAGRRLVDECVHETQALAKKAAEGQPSQGLMSSEPAAAGAVAAPVPR